MDGEFLTARQMVEALGMELDYFRHAIREGLLPRGVRQGKRMVWPRDDIKFIVWLEVNRHRFMVSEQYKIELDGNGKEKCYVYFIQEKTTLSIKIGSSVKPTNRLKSLKTANPNGLDLIGIIPGDADVEREFHKRFAEHRLEGEWFDKEILNDVKSILESEPTG